LSERKPAVTRQASGLSLEADAARLREHIAFLADDALEGREPGTAGYDTAAAYVADRFRELGLTPAGNGTSYYQNVPFRRAYRNASAVQLEVRRADNTTVPLVRDKDYAVGASLAAEQGEVTAGVVFVGYGLVAPELGRDDYAGLDVRGKIVARLSGTPSGFQSEERAFYGARRAKEASDRGALAVISLPTPQSELLFPFSRLVKENRLDQARMGWLREDGTVFTNAPGLQVYAVLSPSGAETLFASAAPVDWDVVLEAAAQDGGVTPTFELDAVATLRQESHFDEIESANVIALLEGSDPVLNDEVLLLSAHLDHIGLSNTDEEDRINNGALDNAAGVATMLEAARLLLGGERPRRSVVFLANTAEEKGLLGAQYFARQPTLGGRKIVANINLDMPLLTYDFQDVVVFGGDRSTLRQSIEGAAAEMGLTLAPDPFPEQGIFTRSDHFRFVEEGVPSVMLATGMANGGEKAWAEHFAKHYHRPSDELENGLDFTAAARFAELKTRITLAVANAQDRPYWNAGDFFARQFKGPQLDAAAEVPNK